MADDSDKKLGDLIKEAAREMENIPMGQGVKGETRLYKLFDKIIPKEMLNIYQKSNIFGTKY